MANLDKQEVEWVKEIQDSLATAKEALRDGARASRKLGLYNINAGRIEAGNCALRLQGGMVKSLGAVIQNHADAADGLAKDWDDGQIVIMGGGGGR